MKRSELKTIVSKIILESMNEISDVYSTNPEGYNFLFRSEHGQPRELGYGKAKDLIQKVKSANAPLRIKRGSATIGGVTGYRMIRYTVLNAKDQLLFYIVTIDSEEGAELVRKGEFGPWTMTTSVIEDQDLNEISDNLAQDPKYVAGYRLGEKDGYINEPRDIESQPNIFKIGYKKGWTTGRNRRWGQKLTKGLTSLGQYFGTDTGFHRKF